MVEAEIRRRHVHAGNDGRSWAMIEMAEAARREAFTRRRGDDGLAVVTAVASVAARGLR
jgi:hypothetical protein